MNFRRATKIALWAAVVRVLLSLYQSAQLGLGLSSMEISSPLYSLLVGLDWLFCGLIVFFALALRSRARGKASAALIIGALIQAAFAAYNLLPFLYIQAYGEILGDQQYLSFLALIWPLTVLAFAIAYLAKPSSWVVRGLGLLAAVEVMLNLLFLVGIFPLNWILVVNIVAVTLVAQWFWLCFLQGGAALLRE